MTMPKSKLGFLLAAVYVFVASLFFIYARFACSADALYCGMIAFMPAFPFILLTATFTSIFLLPASADLEMIVIFFIPVLVNVVLAYFIGSLIQKKFSSKVTRIVGIGAIIIAIMIAGILGIRYFNKSDIWKPDNIVNVNNPVNSGNYCQQDSDCVLMPQYQGCCTSGCEIEAVNIETKNLELETRNKVCSVKKYNCPKIEYCKPHNNQAVCEQNRCVVKEKTSAQTRLQEFEVRQIADTYAEAQGYNLSEYQFPEIVNSKIGEWHLFYNQIYLPDPKTGELMGAPGKYFSVYIDDTTGEVFRLIPGA